MDRLTIEMLARSLGQAFDDVRRVLEEFAAILLESDNRVQRVAEIMKEARCKRSPKWRCRYAREDKRAWLLLVQRRRVWAVRCWFSSWKTVGGKGW